MAGRHAGIRPIPLGTQAQSTPRPVAWCHPMPLQCRSAIRDRREGTGRRAGRSTAARPLPPAHLRAPTARKPSPRRSERRTGQDWLNGLAVPAERLGKPGRRLGVTTKKSAGDALVAADDDRQDERTPS